MNAIDHFTNWLTTQSPTTLMRLQTMRVLPPGAPDAFTAIVAAITTRELRKLVSTELKQRREAA